MMHFLHTKKLLFCTIFVTLFPHDFLIHDLCYTYFSQANIFMFGSLSPCLCVCEYVSSLFCLRFFLLFYLNHFCFLSCVVMFFSSTSSIRLFVDLYSSEEIRYCEKKIWFRNICIQFKES